MLSESSSNPSSIKTGNPRLNFYMAYKGEASEYDMGYVKRYGEGLNATLIFVRRKFVPRPHHKSYLVSQAGFFSAISSAFVIGVCLKLQPDHNERSAALLRAILFTPNQSVIPSETSVVPPEQGDPPNEIVAAIGLLYASLLISLLVAFVAMFGKQWLNRYLRHTGGSMIERRGDRAKM